VNPPNYSEAGYPTVGGIDFRVMGALAILFFTALMIFVVIAADSDETGSGDTSTTTAASSDG